MDYFSALAIFHHTAETGSFTATAKALGVAVSSVTRQIDRLEADLGLPLFARSTRRLSLTRAGKLYLEKTRAVLDDLARANQSLKDEILEPSGKLRLTFPTDYGACRLAPLLSDFARRYPKIELELYAADHFVDLFAEPVDLAVRLGRVEDTRLVARKIAPQVRILVASPDYLALYGEPQTPQDLTRHNCLPYVYRGYAPKWFFRRDGKIQSVPIRGNLSGNSASILLAATLDGQGISHLPDWLVSPHLQKGSLKTVLTDWQITPTPTDEADGVYLVYPPNSRNTAKIDALAGFLLERLGAA
ncbi:LysR family transcriptional regulator [Eikenella sp. Marseille-P7795]|uniref:LysR family transcriptional regulator n=1 Tax=Eikenella sp. Marseille-P7795 TaxID=2866577 RepID=UPI001CE467C5|nr:LysR family transcriptional regulator [Eikenella sp. Marseille-P7795]